MVMVSVDARINSSAAILCLLVGAVCTTEQSAFRLPFVFLVTTKPNTLAFSLLLWAVRVDVAWCHSRAPPCARTEVRTVPSTV